MHPAFQNGARHFCACPPRHCSTILFDNCHEIRSPWTTAFHPTCLRPKKHPERPPIHHLQPARSSGCIAIPQPESLNRLQPAGLFRCQTPAFRVLHEKGHNDGPAPFVAAGLRCVTTPHPGQKLLREYYNLNCPNIIPRERSRHLVYHARSYSTLLNAVMPTHSAGFQK
jgi:hypothetical protein